MNKSDLIEELSKRANVSHKKASETVDLIFDEMMKTLIQGGRIEIRGFGSFMIKQYKSYTGRNPKTKDSIVVPTKRLPYFKVGKELKARVNAGKTPIPPDNDSEDNDED